ncbi:Uncharacterised protein [Bordetella pertussis]|nr:Uncharacterised protein [Bordetella pertussis]
MPCTRARQLSPLVLETSVKPRSAPRPMLPLPVNCTWPPSCMNLASHTPACAAPAHASTPIETKNRTIMGRS